MTCDCPGFVVGTDAVVVASVRGANGYAVSVGGTLVVALTATAGARSSLTLTRQTRK